MVRSWHQRTYFRNTTELAAITTLGTRSLFSGSGTTCLYGGLFSSQQQKNRKGVGLSRLHVLSVDQALALVARRKWTFPELFVITISHFIVTAIETPSSAVRDREVDWGTSFKVRKSNRNQGFKVN